MMSADLAAIAIDGGELPLGGGLLALVRPALDALRPGGVLAVLSSSPGLRDDLPSWCRADRHEYLGVETTSGGADRHLIARGRFSVPRPMAGGAAPGPAAASETESSGEIVHPAVSDPASGFAPRGARLEPGRPDYPFTLNERDRRAPPEAAQLYAQAAAAQWDAARDIPWSKARQLPGPLDAALAQTMTFLAENELSPLYVPSRFMAKIHPAYAETAMFLATQLADEARHIDLFLRRAPPCPRGAGAPSEGTGRPHPSSSRPRPSSAAVLLPFVFGGRHFLR